MVRSKRMMETDEQGIKRQFMPITHYSAVLGLKDFLDGNFFQADFDRVMGMLLEHYERVSKEIDSKAQEIEDYTSQKIIEFDEKIVETGTKLSSIEKELQETQEIIEQNDIPTREEVSANVIDQIIGKRTVQTTIFSDYKDKITGSRIENPNWAGAAFVPDQLQAPSLFKGEFVQSRYESIATKDGATAWVSATGSDLRPSICLKIDVLDIVKRDIGESFFEDRGATTVKHQIAILDLIISNFNVGSYAKGKGLNNGVVRDWVASKLWFDNTRWTTGTPQNETSEIKRLAFTKDPSNSVSRYLNDEGILQMIIYGDLSDGVNTTSANVDYADIKIDLDLSARDHIREVIAAYCGDLGNKNIKFTKVGEV